MVDEDALAALLRQVREAGIDVGHCCVVLEGVFFQSQRTAAAFCERNDKQLVRVSGQVSGWLAKERRRP